MPVFLLHVEYQNNKKKLSFLFSDKLLKGFTKVLFLDKLNRSVKGVRCLCCNAYDNGGGGGGSMLGYKEL